MHYYLKSIPGLLKRWRTSPGYLTPKAAADKSLGPFWGYFGQQRVGVSRPDPPRVSREVRPCVETMRWYSVRRSARCRRSMSSCSDFIVHINILICSSTGARWPVARSVRHDASCLRRSAICWACISIWWEKNESWIYWNSRNKETKYYFAKFW